jgi:hypothetical protein
MQRCRISYREAVVPEDVPAYQPSVAQASMPVTNLADHDVNMGDPDVADADSDIAGLYPDVPMVATPTSSYAGKRSHSDMEPTGATTATAFTISEPRHHQGEPDPPKKQKSSRGGTPSSRTSQRSTVKGDKTNAVAMVAIQNSISHLSDTLVATLSNTDESRVADERRRALQILQYEEEGLTIDEKVALAHIFENRPGVTATYLNFTGEMRRAYMLSLLTGKHSAVQAQPNL